MRARLVRNDIREIYSYTTIFHLNYSRTTILWAANPLAEVATYLAERLITTAQPSFEIFPYEA